MKLLKSAACHLASDGGNVKEMTVMGDAAMERFSDRGSIPLSSIKQSKERPQYRKQIFRTAAFFYILLYSALGSNT